MVSAKKGNDYADLHPLFSLWILDENLPSAVGLPPAQWHSVFELRDRSSGRPLSDHLEIHAVELQKWTPGATALDREQQWIYFLRDGGNWDQLPPELNSPLLRKAMEVLDRISEKEEDYYRYLSRLNFERQQRTLENDMERERTLKEQALAEKERALAQEERALAQEGRALKEVEQLRAQLRALGVDPDTSA